MRVIALVISLAATGLLVAGCSADPREVSARSSTQGVAEGSAGSDSQGGSDGFLPECRISPDELSRRTRTADAVQVAAAMTEFTSGQKVELDLWEDTLIGQVDEGAFYDGFRSLCGSEYWDQIDPEQLFCGPQNLLDCNRLRGTYTVVDGQPVRSDDVISDKVAVVPRALAALFCNSLLRSSYSSEMIEEAAGAARTAGVSESAARDAVAAFIDDVCQ